MHNPSSASKESRNALRIGRVSPINCYGYQLDDLVPLRLSLRSLRLCAQLFVARKGAKNTKKNAKIQ
jgi:hypothetical protein